MSSCDRDRGVGAKMRIWAWCVRVEDVRIKSGGLRPVRVRVCGDRSPVRASVSGCCWGTEGVGQELLGPWWCKRSERTSKAGFACAEIPRPHRVS
jgi:hypothetical protein